VYVGSGDDHLYAFNLPGGTKPAERPALLNLKSDPSLVAS
jgi:hypothetical protein